MSQGNSSNRYRVITRTERLAQQLSRSVGAYSHFDNCLLVFWGEEMARVPSSASNDPGSASTELSSALQFYEQLADGHLIEGIRLGVADFAGNVIIVVSSTSRRRMMRPKTYPSYLA